MPKPRLSVLCIAYNQAQFIRQALDGFLAQRTRFDFEVIVHDDASTDGTDGIIRDYAARHPDVIRPLFETENQYSQGKAFLQDRMFPLVRGEYVALCEGDDYWTDPDKLQKQVDWLDAHPASGLCFHPVCIRYEDGSRPDETFPPSAWGEGRGAFSFAELLRRNFVQTNSVVYRWRLHGEGAELPRSIMPRDWYLHLLHAESGEIGFLPETMSVYRRHSGGVWWGDRRGDAFYLRNGLAHLAFYRAVEDRFGFADRERTMSMARATAAAALRRGDCGVMDSLMRRFPEVCAEIGHSLADAQERLTSVRRHLDRLERLVARRRRRMNRWIAVLAVLAAALAAANILQAVL